MKRVIKWLKKLFHICAYRLKKWLHICDHHWVDVEHGTCDHQEGRWGWGYQLYWVDRCTKCGKIRRQQTHWPIDVDSID